MKRVTAIASLLLSGALLAGCGEKDYTGTYRSPTPNAKLVLNIRGKSVEVWKESRSGEFLGAYEGITLTQNEDKLFIDDNKNNRLVFKRNIDEQSLDCLNCKRWGFPDDELTFKRDPNGPYDLNKIRDEQRQKEEAKEKAYWEQAQKEAAKAARTKVESKKLDRYQGDWVQQRISSYEKIAVLGIWANKPIKYWKFDYDNVISNRTPPEPDFIVDDRGLTIGDDDNKFTLVLGNDKKTLICISCSPQRRWVRADDNKDLSDISYMKQLAGRP